MTVYHGLVQLEKIPILNFGQCLCNVEDTVMCLSIGHLKLMKFPFVPNVKFIIFRYPNIWTYYCLIIMCLNIGTPKNINSYCICVNFCRVLGPKHEHLLLYPRFEKVGGILVYICPWFRPWFRLSFRPSFRNSVTLFRQRYLLNRLR